MATKEWGNGNFTTHVYAVEARAAHGSVVLKVGERFLGKVNPVSNIVLTPHEWTRMHFDRALVGVPNHLELYPSAQSHGFMTYSCAMALACWLQAEHEAVETRLVQIEYKESYSTREIGVGPVMNLWEEDRELYWHLTGKNGGKVRSVLPQESAQAVGAVDPKVTK